MLHDDAGAFDGWFAGQGSRTRRVGGRWAGETCHTSQSRVSALGRLTGGGRHLSLSASVPQLTQRDSSRLSVAVPTLSSREDALDFWGMGAAVPISVAVANQVKSFGAQAELMLRDRQAEEWADAAEHWKAASKLVARLGQRGGKLGVADVAAAAQSKALVERRLERWKHGMDIVVVGVASSEDDSDDEVEAPDSNASVELDGGGTRTHPTPMDHHAKLAEVRELARTSGVTGIEAWTMMREREHLESATERCVSAPSMVGRPKSAPRAYEGNVQGHSHVSAASDDAHVALHDAAKLRTTAGGIGIICSTHTQPSSSIPLDINTRHRPSTVGCARDRKLRPVPNGHQRGIEGTPWEPCRPSLETLMPECVDLSGASHSLCERCTEAKLICEAFAERHESAARRAQTAMRIARGSSDMIGKAEPHFTHALVSIRRNRLGLPGIGTALGKLGRGDVEWLEDAGTLETLRLDTERSLAGSEEGEMVFAEDGELVRIASWLTPLFTSEDPLNKSKELREVQQVLFTARKLLARAFDTFCAQGGLAVGIRGGGRPDPPPPGAEDKARELAAAAAPGDAWILAGAGTSMCRSQWWRLLKCSGVLGNGLTCSDVDFLFTEVMTLAVVDTRKQGGMYEMAALLEASKSKPAQICDGDSKDELIQLVVESAPHPQDDASPREAEVLRPLAARGTLTMAPEDPHDPLACINFEAFVLTLCHLAHTKYKATERKTLGVKIKALIDNHLLQAIDSPSPLDLISRAIREPEMTNLLAEHLVLLRVCWKYWNTLHGKRKVGRGRVPSPTKANDDAVTRMKKEVFLLDAYGDAKDLLSNEDRFNYNEVLLMFKEADVFQNGGRLKRRHLYELFEVTTCDRPLVTDVHPSNARDELIFDEFVELLVRAAVRARGARLSPPFGEGPISMAWLNLIDDFLYDFYKATDRFYPGNLMRIVKKTLGGDGGLEGDSFSITVESCGHPLRSGAPSHVGAGDGWGTRSPLPYTPCLSSTVCRTKQRFHGSSPSSSPSNGRMGKASMPRADEKPLLVSTPTLNRASSRSLVFRSHSSAFRDSSEGALPRSIGQERTPPRWQKSPSRQLMVETGTPPRQATAEKLRRALDALLIATT